MVSAFILGFYRLTRESIASIQALIIQPEENMASIQLDIEWTEAASRKIGKLMPHSNQGAPLALPPIECLPMEGDVLFLGPQGQQQPFIVAERQYHHEGDADWTIILILDVPQQ
jgi:hypothetical protein